MAVDGVLQRQRHLVSYPHLGLMFGCILLQGGGQEVMVIDGDVIAVGREAPRQQNMSEH